MNRGVAAPARRTTRRGLALVALCVALAATATARMQDALAASPAQYGVLSAESGGVKASVEYVEFHFADAPLNRKALRLTITRDGASAYDAEIASPNCAPCELEELADSRSPVSVADLEGTGQPDVIVDLYTGGAHCCTILQIYSFDPGTMTYRPLEHDFGDPGARIADVAGDGHLELESADDRFAYEFTPYAYSGLPLQVWSVREGRLVDTTRSFRSALVADAAKWLKAFRQARREGTGNGVIAAWAADEELLGHGGLVKRTLAREASRGNLRSREHFGPSGHRFVVKLMRFLKRLGYV